MKVQVNVPQLQQALMTNAQLQNQMAGAQQLQQGNGYAGGLGILGAALGGFMQGRKAKELAANEFDINQQIAAFQEQKAQELAMAEQARAEQEYKRKLAEKEQERAFEMQKLAAQQQGQLGLEQFKVNNRQAPQMSAEQQWLNSLPPEQRNQIFAQKYAGQQNSLFTPQEQALIQAGKVDPEQLAQVKANDAMGVKEVSDTTRQKLSFLRNAKAKLEKYKEGAFEFKRDQNGKLVMGEDGKPIMTDYKEFGSKFGNTNNNLIEAVRNKLRAESGASITDQEASAEASLFSPSMIRTDETNYSKIMELEETLARLEQELAGETGTRPQQGQLTQQGMDKTQQLLNKYLSQ